MNTLLSFSSCLLFAGVLTAFSLQTNLAKSWRAPDNSTVGTSETSKDSDTNTSDKDQILTLDVSTGSGADEVFTVEILNEDDKLIDRVKFTKGNAPQITLPPGAHARVRDDRDSNATDPKGTWTLEATDLSLLLAANGTYSAGDNPREPAEPTVKMVEVASNLAGTTDKTLVLTPKATSDHSFVVLVYYYPGGIGTKGQLVDAVEYSKGNTPSVSLAPGTKAYVLDVDPLEDKEDSKGPEGTSRLT